MMIEFLKATRESPTFSFKLRGRTEDAKSFIHRMRVELSRMRDSVIQSGKVPKEFKVLVDDIAYDSETQVSTVTLRKAYGTNVQIADDVAEIFNEISAGNQIQT